MHRPIRRSSSLLTIGIAAVLLAACSRGAGGGATASASSAAAGGPTLSVATTDIGNVVTGADGKTLYMFMKDTDAKSACNAGCVETWPPLTLPTGSEAVAGTGVTAEWLHTITRDDGTQQVTFGGHPLYYYSADQAAGDVKGEGIGGQWFAAGAEGQPLKASASASASASPSATGGYGY